MGRFSLIASHVVSTVGWIMDHWGIWHRMMPGDGKTDKDSSKRIAECLRGLISWRRCGCETVAYAIAHRPSPIAQDGSAPNALIQRHHRCSILVLLMMQLFRPLQCILI